MHDPQFDQLLQNAKARNVRDIARQLMGAPDNHNYKDDRYSYHRLYGGAVERTPSLVVWDVGFRCYSAAWADHEDGSGDGIKLWMIHQGCDFKEAVYGINNLMPPVEVNKPITESQFTPPPRETPTIREVQTYAREHELAVTYFHDRRAISVPTIDEMLFGAKTDMPARYVFRDGSDVQFQYIGYAIPNIAFGEVRAINFRRDDERCAQMLLRNEKTLERISIDLKERSGEDYTLQQIIDQVFLRYKAKGQKGLMYNADLLGSRAHDGSVVPTPWPVVNVVEGEIDAVTGRDRGYITVTYPSKQNALRAFAGAAMINLIADNDPNGAGIQKALTWQQLLGPERTRIVIPPAHAKDLNGLAQRNELDQWMQSQRIPKLLK